MDWFKLPNGSIFIIPYNTVSDQNNQHQKCMACTGYNPIYSLSNLLLCERYQLCYLSHRNLWLIRSKVRFFLYLSCSIGARVAHLLCLNALYRMWHFNNPSSINLLLENISLLWALYDISYSDVGSGCSSRITFPRWTAYFSLTKWLTCCSP